MSNVLITISIIAPIIGNSAVTITPVTFLIITFIRRFNTQVISIPIAPLVNPTINVSALNTLDISFLLAPIALNIPISLVLYNTEI